MARQEPLAKLKMAKVGAKGRRRRRHAYSDAELAPLQAAAPEPRRTAYAAAGYSGLRRGTLMQLQKQDLDPTGPQPRWAVRGEIMKAGRPLNVPMVPESSDAIRARWEQLPSPTSLLFGTNTERRRVKNQKRTVVPAIVTLVEDLKAAKVERVDVQGRRADFHSFRYTFCRLMGERLPIQKVKALMGHSTIKLTADLYGELGMEDVAEDVWALPPLAAKGSPQGATPVSTPAVRLSSTG